MLIDTHAHLDEQSFHADLEDVLTRAREAGVETIFTIGITADTSQSAVQLAEQYSQIYAVVGIQPNYVAEMKPHDFALIEELSTHPKVVAIGETGLDRYWDHCPIDAQQVEFRKHITLSKSVNKPFIVHCRDADEDVVSLLKEEANGEQLKGVMHSFCGSQQTADSCLELGLHLSFAGMLTFKRNEELRAIAKSVPLDRLLVETDSPYLAPVPNRGKRNEPAHVVHTAQVLAEIHGVSLEKMSAITTQNVQRLFFT